MATTESASPRFTDIETWPTVEAIDAMLESQFSALACIKAQVPLIAAASEAGAARLKRGGRLIYVGAGTSGRIAVQDGVELGPTFGWPRERLEFVIAGGMAALSSSAEYAEDDAIAGQSMIAALNLMPNDVVIGVAASGRTPFTVAAIEYARCSGAMTIGLANNCNTVLLIAAEHGILADTGSEVIAGSTRMKAGTAQKIILNMLSTAMMLQLGGVYRGLMVNMVISNEKLRQRALVMVESLSGCDSVVAEQALKVAGGNIKKAVLVARGQSAETATSVLLACDDDLRCAIDASESI